jgi:isovaleryl-CoA dehydrogenase
MELRNAVRLFARNFIAPYAAAIDEANRFPREQLWRELGNLGVLGVSTAEAYGGLGRGLVEHCLVMEELSRASASIGLSYGAHSNLCMMQIERHGRTEQKEQLLPPLCNGTWVGALAMSETGAGSDVLGSMRTIARQSKRTTDTGSIVPGWCIQGSKMWITNGPDADALVLYARTPELEPKSTSGLKDEPQSRTATAVRPSITAFVLQTAQLGAGYRVAQKLDKLGMRGSNTCELVFDDVWVPEDAVLGQPGQGTRVLMAGLDAERLVLSAGPLGIMQACLDVVLPYVGERKQFQRPIGTFPLMQAKLADMYGALACSRAHTYGLAAAFDGIRMHANDSSSNTLHPTEGSQQLLRGFRKDCAAVILQNAERATQCALQAIQALGGNGYVSDYPTGRLLRDAKLYEIGAGTSEIRRMLIGRELYEAAHPRQHGSD